MSDVDKLQVVVPQWVEHSADHAREFRRWADRAGSTDEKISAAADLMDPANTCLEEVLERVLEEARKGQR